MGAVPKLKKLSDEYEDQGLVLIGVHSTKRGETMEAFVKGKGIGYPVAVDVDGVTAAAYKIDGRPDYHIIDRSGNLRVADCANADVERVVKALLEEDAPAAVPPALADAAATAQKKDQRILALFGSTVEREAFWKSVQRHEGYRALRYEFTVAGLAADDAPELAEAAGASAGALTAAAFDAHGSLLGSSAMNADDIDGAIAFLETHRIPQKDATTLMADAIERANAKNKRVFLHFGSPT